METQALKTLTRSMKFCTLRDFFPGQQKIQFSNMPIKMIGQNRMKAYADLKVFREFKKENT